MADISNNMIVDLIYGDITAKELATKLKCSKMTIYRKKSDFLKKWNHDKGNSICLGCTDCVECSVVSTQGNRMYSALARCTYKKFHNILKLPTNAIIVHINGDVCDTTPNNLYMMSCKEIATSYIMYKRLNKVEIHPHEFMKIRGNYLMETLFNPEWLYEEYVVKELSMSAMSRMYDIPVSTISHVLHRYNSPGDPSMKIIDCRPKYVNGYDAFKVRDNLITIDIARMVK